MFAGPGPVGMPPYQPRPAKVSKHRGKIVAVLVTLATLGACAITGSVAGNSGTEPTGPANPPPFTLDFPDVGKQYLPDLTVSMVAKDWLEKQNAYKCAPNTDNKPGSGAKQMLDCEPGDADLDVWVSIEYDDEAKVREVNAHCNYKPGTPYCKSLFENLADVVHAKNASLRQQSLDWAGKNVDSDSTTVIGGVYFEIHLSPHSITATPWI